MGDPQAVISVSNLVVRKQGQLILDHLSFSIPAGQVTGLIGPSGSGKTTLLRAIVGSQSITSGQVQVLGQTAGSSGLRGRIGYMTQSPALYRDLTVEQNVRYFAAALGLSRTAISQSLEAVALTKQGKQLTVTLSGGEQARVSLAIALLGEPELLVLDEPTVGLDPVLREQLWELFRGLAGQGRSLLVSSHVMDEAARCERLLLLREGKLLADTTPQRFLKATGTRDLAAAFVAAVQRETST